MSFSSATHAGECRYRLGMEIASTSLPPAAAPHECLLRTSYMATHTEALLDEAMDIMAEVLVHE